MDKKTVIYEHAISQFKPTEQIELLIRHLLPVAIQKKYPANRCIHLDSQGERLGLLLLEGQVDTSRKENGLLKGTAKAPFIFGMSHPEYIGNAYTISSVTPVSIAVLPYREAMQVIREQELWIEYCSYLQYIIGLNYSISYANSGISATDVVKRCLTDLMIETELYRQQTNACKYIVEKTALSRSGVMAILAKLKSQKLIVTERGKLISVRDDILERAR